MKLSKINTTIFILVASLIGVVNLTADDEIRNDDNWDLINHYWYIRQDLSAGVERRNAEYIRKAIQAGINVNDRIYKNDDFKAIHQAASRLYPEGVKLLLDAGADVNAQDDLGYTPLMWAIVTRSDGTANQERDRFEVISLLLNHPDIDLNRRSKITHGDATAIEFSQDNPRVFRLITAIIAIKSRHPKFGDLYQAIISNDLNKVTEIVELSLNTFGYWKSCTPNKKLALQLAQDFKADEIYNYLCTAWNVPLDDDSWKSTALNIMDWLCYLHPDTV